MANNKLITCRHCGHEIAKGAKHCPNCGGKNKKPIWKRGGLWVLLILVIVGVAVGTGGKGKQKANSSGSAAYSSNSAASSAQSKPSASKPQPPKEEKAEEKPVPTETEAETESPTEEEVAAEAEPEEKPSPVEEIKEAVVEAVIDPEFKEMMDSYERFFDDYIAFMKKYQSSSYSASMLSDYLNFMSDYADWAEKLEALDEDDMNEAELAYYTEVQLRVSKKMMDAAL